MAYLTNKHKGLFNAIISKNKPHYEVFIRLRKERKFP
nr:MAG TPA: hypothetical protein [Bacteriophage sp.]